MDLDTIVKFLNLKVFCGFDRLQTEVLNGYTGDLLSDVMANSKEGDLWITRQVHQNIIAVASLKEHAGVVLVQGAEPAKDTLAKAIEEMLLQNAQSVSSTFFLQIQLLPYEASLGVFVFRLDLYRPNQISLASHNQSEPLIVAIPFPKRQWQ